MSEPGMGRRWAAQVRARGAAGLARADAVLAPLDRLRARTALLAGAGLGLGGGLLLLGPESSLGAGAAGLCLGGAALLGLSGRPQLALAGLPTRRLDEPLEMVELPGGTFLRGSPAAEAGRYDNEGPQQRITVSPFAMARHLTTQALYAELMGENPGDPRGEGMPANKVTWWDALELCNRLSLRVGLTPCYVIERERGQVRWEREADGYRLPTEAEWEYAARAGTTTAYSFGDDPALLERHAWFLENSDDVPHPVGLKEPNPFGLYDMHGNLWEWCWDIYGPYAERPQVAPAGPSKRVPVGVDRVVRGGSFVDKPRFLRSAYRGRGWPEGRLGGLGFRCVRGAGRQP